MTMALLQSVVALTMYIILVICTTRIDKLEREKSELEVRVSKLESEVLS